MVDLERYQIRGVEQLLTPALVIYDDIVDHNIDVTLRAFGGDPRRWRPHVKTAKLAHVIRKYVARGIRAMKCATTLELITVCEAGAEDVLLAFPVVGAVAARVRKIAERYPKVQISVLVENSTQALAWRGSRIGTFVDVNPGMNRTGIEQDRIEALVALVGGLGDFRGLHYYDGHMHIADLKEREQAAHAGYAKLMQLVDACEKSGKAVPEVITAGTPAMLCAAGFAPFASGRFVHSISPGTVVYGDATSLNEIPQELLDYRAAALVIATVVSHPIPGRITCDAGHKSVSADAGVPTCQVLGHPDWKPLKPSEEHLPIDLPAGEAPPAIGSQLYLLPRHVCPTVNNFDEALIVRGGEVFALERVTARGHESPIVKAAVPA